MRHVTVGEVLDLEIFHGTTPDLISTPDSAAAERRVRWMHVLESARPEGLLPGGEFILTTATFLDQIVDGQNNGFDAANQFLDTIEATGAVAIVAEVLPSRPRVINALKAAACERTTPIYLLYDRIRFVELTQFVHENIAAARLQEVEIDRRIHDAFTSLSVGSASTGRIVAEATALLGSQVEWESVEQRNSGMVGAAHEVVAGDEELGRLIVHGIGAADESLVQTVLERAGQAVAISVLALRSQREMRRSTASSLFYQLRGGTELSAQEVQWRLTEAFGYAPIAAVNWVPIVFRISGRQQSEERLNRWSGILLDVLEQLGSVQRSPVFAARSEIGVVDVLAPSSSSEELHNFIKRTNVRFRSLMRGQGRLVAGIAVEAGSMKTAAQNLVDAAQIAQAAEAYVAAFGRQRTYFYAQDLGLRGLLATLQHDKHFITFVGTELVGLLAKCNSRAALKEQLDFLEAVLSEDNKAALARKLRISRPALYARLQRLESQLGYRLQDDTERRTALHLALIAYRLNPEVVWRQLDKQYDAAP